MINSKTVSKHLESLNISGHGNYMSPGEDLIFGCGIYEINLEDGVLRFFENGLVIISPKKNIEFLYADISKITSHLSAASFSNASAAQNVNVSIPLEIDFSEGTFVFYVKLLIYSRLLIVLNHFWRNSGAK